MNRLPTLRRIFTHRPIRQVCAVLMALSVLWLAWSVLLAPVKAYIEDNQQQVAQSRAVLQRYDRLAAALPTLEADQVALAKATEAERWFYVGTNPAITGTRLLSDVQRLALANRIDIRSNQTLPALQEAGFDKLGLQLELAGDAEALARFLSAAERAEPALFIGELSIHVPPTGAAPLTADGQPSLTIRCRIFGFGRKGGV